MSFIKTAIPPPNIPAPSPTAGVDLTRMTKQEIVDLAEAKFGVTLDITRHKDDLIADFHEAAKNV